MQLKAVRGSKRDEARPCGSAVPQASSSKLAGDGLKLATLVAMSITSDTFTGSPVRLVAVVCAAQVLVQIGAFFWPALLPGMMHLWRLSNSEAGWITASFYGAYMVSVTGPRHLDRPN